MWPDGTYHASLPLSTTEVRVPDFSDCTTIWPVADPGLSGVCFSTVMRTCSPPGNIWAALTASAGRKLDDAPRVGGVRRKQEATGQPLRHHQAVLVPRQRRQDPSQV